MYQDTKRILPKMSIMGIIWEEEDFQIFYSKKKKLKAYSTFQFLKK